MSFRDGVAGFSAKVETKSKRVFAGVCAEVQRSVVNGSEITGAPGQPVASGRLKASWIGEFVDEHRFELTTDVPYAEIIETNARGAELRSSVGGFHSLSLTQAGFGAIVAHVVQREAGGAK